MAKQLTLKQKFVRALANTKAYAWAMDNVVPYVRTTMYYTKMRGYKMLQGYALLQPGDFIVTVDYARPTTAIIGGEWSHAAWCAFKEPRGLDYECVEMTHTNFTFSNFFDIAAQADEFAIVRINGLTETQLATMRKAAASLTHAIYDDKFEMDSRASLKRHIARLDAYKTKGEDLYLSCSELCYAVDVDDLAMMPFETIEAIGSEYITPMSVFNAANCTVVYDSRKAKAPVATDFIEKCK